MQNVSRENEIYMHGMEKHSHINRFALSLLNRNFVKTLKWSIPDPIQDSNLAP